MNGKLTKKAFLFFSGSFFSKTLSRALNQEIDIIAMSFDVCGGRFLQ